MGTEGSAMTSTANPSTAHTPPSQAWCWHDTPVGRLTLAASAVGLTSVALPPVATEGAHTSRESNTGASREARAVLASAGQQLDEYFAGRRRVFTLPLDMGGTPFQRRVWDVVATIGYGHTLTYGDVAARIGEPTAMRAVGAASGHNPLPLVIPCHRVVGRGGRLVGYGGGLALKQALLVLEGARLV